MKDETAADRMRLMGLVLARRLRGTIATARRPWSRLKSGRSRPPRRLAMAPQDIRTADPTVAADIYSGYFFFDGKAVNTRGASPFEVTPPSEAWAATLAGFGWLRHLRAADTALSRANARALVGDWIGSPARARGGPGARPAVVARRMLAWLSQSPLILEGADDAFYRRFLRSLARQSDLLVRSLERGREGPGRLATVVALAEFALCAEGSPRLQRRASRMLSDEIGREILPDGGHVSRNPEAIVELLLDLLPLRQTFVARGVEPPPTLLNAIDRMMPMLRAFRHADGALALFNGARAAGMDALATVLAHDDGSGAALSNAPYSGYQRIEAGRSILIVDAGRPPPPVHATAAHAGTLAFEFSSGTQRIVVNCGAASPGQPAAFEASRATAAHSTLVLGDRSSSRFAARGPLAGMLYAGPSRVEATRVPDAGGTGLDLSHDGYARGYGLVHRRRLWLSEDGDRLVGEDRLDPAGSGRGARRLAVAIRFHLHPGVSAAPLRTGSAVLIGCPDGQRWLFEADGWPISVEESIFFAGSEGSRRTDQIAIHAELPGFDRLRWSLVRDGRSGG